MGVFGKRRVVLAALVLTLSLAVYLNWQFADTGKDLKATGLLEDSNKNYGDTVLVNGTTKVPVEKTTGAAKGSGHAYFEEARANREAARDEALDLLREMAGNVKASDEEKAAANAKITEISTRINDEADAENLIRAKGFKDCVVIIGDSKVNVVVNSAELMSGELMMIKEIVVDTCKVKSGDIHVVPVK